MVTADEDGEHGRDGLARVVLVEGAHVAVLDGARHRREVGLVAHGLEVAADEEHVDLGAVHRRELLHRRVDVVELPVAAALDGNQDHLGRGLFVLDRASAS
eukprot:scaffold108903_cov69-Phaeocystis_antarctica.AAC.2